MWRKKKRVKNKKKYKIYRRNLEEKQSSWNFLNSEEQAYYKQELEDKWQFSGEI